MEAHKHSTAHILAQATKRLKPEAKIGIGPAIEGGFYYDFEAQIRDEDLPLIEEEMRRIVAAGYEIERQEVSREEAAALFASEPYKLELLEAIPSGEPITVYRQGEFVDLCRGPHVGRTSEAGVFKLTHTAGAYWRGDVRRPQLRRIYGIWAASEAELKEKLEAIEEAKKSDHRKIGQEMELFIMREEAPGEVFLLPNGVELRRQMMRYWRKVHEEYGYKEISTPAMMKRGLWEKSGHWEHYAQGMYTLRDGEEDYAIKPMNCPGSVLVYLSTAQKKSLSQPLKLAEIGQVHRREAGGTLHGLFRLREFTQDDAHIYCRPEQISEVINETIELIGRIYEAYGLTYKIELSTRPQDSIGSDEIWEVAEGALKSALRGREYEINEGDGAFYGPKIDFHVRDRMGRSWQCGTIQLDFNLPERFKLEEASGARPVMIHRVAYGSIERYMGMITEHYGGRYPIWLSPEQGVIIPIGAEQAEYAESVLEIMRRSGLRVRLDGRKETLNKRIKAATLRKVPFIIVIGAREAEAGRLSIRTIGKRSQEEMEVSEYIRRMKEAERKMSLSYDI